jgi:diguanylate cyclase (GGDEF)-like protein
LNWWRWLMQLPEQEDALEQEIRMRQFRACMQLMPMTAPATCLLAVASQWYFFEITPWPLVAFGLVAVLVSATDSLFHYFMSRTMERDLSDRDLVRLVLREVFMAAGLVAPSVAWFYRVESDQQMILIAVVAALIGLGGFILSPLALAGIAWAICATVFGSLALAISGRTVDWVLFGLLIGYCAIVCMTVFVSSRALMGRVLAEARAERQRDVMGLLLKDFEGSSRDWLWETDQRGHLRHVSIRLMEAFVRQKRELEGLSLVDLLRITFSSAGRDEVEAHDFLQLRLASRQPFRDQVVPVVLGDEIKWWSLTAKPLFNNKKVHVGWRGVGSDVTDVQRREIEMTQLANFDSLTGLANRYQFRAYLDSVLTSNPDGDQVMLLVLDLDNFKNVNDTLGHMVGDALLHDIAQRLLLTTGENELLARLGGDEYALVMPGRFDEAQCVARAQLLLDALRAPFEIQDTRIEVRGSVGIACAPQHGTHSDDLLKAADTALYASKDAGRDAVNLFTHEMDQRARMRLSIQSDLGQALENDEFELHYQPQVDARTMHVVGFEALLRWRRGDSGLVWPSHFIPVAEETGLIVPIGAWALQQACRDAMQWPDELFVAVNLSAVQFASRGLLEVIENAVKESGITPQRLELEITESSLIADSSHARELLKVLRASGHHIALDDFGTGYSSLAYLRSFPIDKLKIDGAFTKGLETDEKGEASAIVRAIIQLAAALRLSTTAEGVETREQLDTLRAKGCNEIQGYYVAQPMPAQEIAAFLEAWEQEREALLPRLSTSISNHHLIGLTDEFS